MDTHEFEAPFRWNIQERATLGSLLDGPRKDFPNGPPPYVPVIEPVYYYILQTRSAR